MEGRLDNAVRGRLRLRHLDLLVGLNNTGSLHKVAARLAEHDAVGGHTLGKQHPA